jgi:hypothetical protein
MTLTICDTAPDFCAQDDRRPDDAHHSAMAVDGTVQ